MMKFSQQAGFWLIYYNQNNRNDKRRQSFPITGNSNLWILFDFKKRKVQINTYYLKTRYSQYHMKNWFLEASNGISKIKN